MLAGTPLVHAVAYAVAQRPAIRACAPRDRPWNADEFGAHRLPVEPNLGVAVSTQVDEGQVRRQGWEASVQLRNLMKESSASFEAIQKLEAPSFEQIFKNDELRREFENLTRKLDTPTS